MKADRIIVLSAGEEFITDEDLFLKEVWVSPDTVIYDSALLAVELPVEAFAANIAVQGNRKISFNDSLHSMFLTQIPAFCPAVTASCQPGTASSPYGAALPSKRWQKLGIYVPKSHKIIWEPKIDGQKLHVKAWGVRNQVKVREPFGLIYKATNLTQATSAGRTVRVTIPTDAYLIGLAISAYGLYNYGPTGYKAFVPISLVTPQYLWNTPFRFRIFMARDMKEYDITMEPGVEFDFDWYYGDLGKIHRFYAYLPEGTTVGLDISFVGTAPPPQYYFSLVVYYMPADYVEYFELIRRNEVNVFGMDWIEPDRFKELVECKGRLGNEVVLLG